jgi:hypothetical protein
MIPQSGHRFPEKIMRAPSVRQEVAFDRA